MLVWEDTHSQPEWSFSVTLTPDGCSSHVIFGGGSRTKKKKTTKGQAENSLMRPYRFLPL